MDESLFVNLKVLAKLEPFQKINTRGRLFKVSTSSDTPSYLPEFIKRWWDGSTRDSDFSRIRDLVAKAFNALRNDHDRRKIISHLRRAVDGLRSLAKTYEQDLTYVCRITALIENIEEETGRFVDDLLDMDD